MPENTCVLTTIRQQFAKNNLALFPKLAQRKEKIMDISANFFAANSATLMAVAAILCGVALLHLVIVRTINHRDKK
ncbi:MAG: hypothetical protein ACU0DI_02270 [Paracoccaceae bacterium]